MLHYVYILKCRDGSLYTGLTSNLKRRMAEHSEGKSVCTKNKRPVKLVFYSCFLEKSTAAMFEQYLKSHSGREFRKKHFGL